MVEERAMEKWMALEMTRFHRSFVANPRPLVELLAEAEPVAATRGGEMHHYDTAALRQIDAALSPLARRRARLPITFFVDKDLANDAHVADETGVEILRALGEIPREIQPREGKLWIGHAKAKLIANRYPGAFQFVHF